MAWFSNPDISASVREQAETMFCTLFSTIAFDTSTKLKTNSRLNLSKSACWTHFISNWKNNHSEGTSGRLRFGASPNTSVAILRSKVPDNWVAAHRHFDSLMVSQLSVIEALDELFVSIDGLFKGYWGYLEQNTIISVLERKLFILESNHVGLGPETAKRHDLVVFLSGGTVPYVIREQKGMHDGEVRYDFIGECYIDGFMDGAKYSQVLEERGLK
jgi:hypothetical protein